ncbi:MAG: T9SS type A sorting domain-containing protein [Bacteroidota bacterium]
MTTFTFSIWNFRFSIYKIRLFQKPILTLTWLLLGSFHYALVAQTGCPDCVIALPDSLQEDTFYLQEFPDGQYRVTYDESITYRLPTNTSQVLYLVPSLPAGIGIGELAIKSINGLPAGLSWEPSQKSYDLPDERDGCVRICGTPLQFGTFELEITVTAQVAIISQDATFRRSFFVAPPTISNDGFTMTNNVGCGSTNVSFENNNPSNGQAGYSYQWDFGLGGTSADENPQPQTYSETGIYPVKYQAIIDTVGYILTEVKINEASCDDFLGKPDLKIRITDPNDNIIFQNESVDNLEPPVTFPLNLKIEEGNYKLEVIDDDSGLGGSDDLCGTINFNQLSNGNLEDGDLKVSINIFHPVDTINSVDSVVVYDIPFAPIVSFDGDFIFCEGDTLELSASALSATQQWYRDSTPISGATDPQFGVTEDGGYYVQTTSENGCINTSPIAFLGPIPLPDAPVLKQEGNLLSIFNPAILPDPYSLRWFQEGNLLDYTAFALCIEETGKYGIELTNSTSGCSNYFESTYAFDENGVCTTSAEDLLAKVNQVKIYPNPVQSNFLVELVLLENLENGTISLINSLGQIIDYQLIDNTTTEQLIRFDLVQQPAGLYFIQLRNGADVTSWKVLKR